MFHTDMSFSVFVDSSSQTLEAMERVSGLRSYGQGVGLSFSKGTPIKLSVVRTVYGTEQYPSAASVSLPSQDPQSA